LTDCADGCTGQLAPFGREGYFYVCEGEYQGDDVYSIVQRLEQELGQGKPDIEPMALCSSIGRREYAVRNDILYYSRSVEGEPFDAACDATYFGGVGDELIAHKCAGLIWTQGLATRATIGYVYNSGGETYWLQKYGLYRFVPEAVTESFSACNYLEQPSSDDLAACSQPTYPAIGGIPEEFAGFWAMCPDVSSDQFAEPDLDTCATLEWDESSWLGAEYATSILWLRNDGYAVDTRLTSRHTAYCSTAFRALPVPDDYVGNGVPIAVISRFADELWFDDEDWHMFEYSGETFLSAQWGTLRRIPRPAAFSDACDTSTPALGF
jgi:hypothetical protein